MSSSKSDRGRGRGSAGRGRGKIDKADEVARDLEDLKIPETPDEFCKWFWKGSNGNDLIKKLNASKHRESDFVRREKYRPVVYCVVLNHGSFPGKSEDLEGMKKIIQWKVCKVGFTHADTTPGSNNRMEGFTKEVCRKYEAKKEGRKSTATASASVLFVLPVGAVDTTPFFDTEKRIRTDVGWPIVKELAKKIGLPCSTEWVLTTQDFIDKIKVEIEKRKGTADPIDLFKELKFSKQNPMPKHPPWAVLEHLEVKKEGTSEQFTVVTNFTNLEG